MNGPNEQQLAFLQQYGFDAELQKRWQQDVAAGRLSKAGNAIPGELLAPPPSALKKLPGSTTKAARELERIGREALQKGEVGVVVLNGGMATRFGGKPKGVIHTFASRTATYESLGEAWTLAPEDYTLHILPMHRIHGVQNILDNALTSGVALLSMVCSASSG